MTIDRLEELIVTAIKIEDEDIKKALKEEIVKELRSIIFDYQETMTKDTEQSLKNLVDMIEGDIK